MFHSLAQLSISILYVQELDVKKLVFQQQAEAAATTATRKFKKKKNAGDTDQTLRY